MVTREQAWDAYLAAEQAGSLSRERAACVLMLMDDLTHVPTQKGNMWLEPLAPDIATQVTDRGWRWHPEKAVIKKRRVHAAGVMEDACVWVNINEPDDPLENLEQMSFADINALPPELQSEAKARLGIGQPVQPDPGWTAAPQVLISDDPEAGNAGIDWH